MALTWVFPRERALQSTPPICRFWRLASEFSATSGITEANPKNRAPLVEPYVSRPLRPDELRLAELLMRTGLSRPAARCLVCIARGGEWTSSMLAKAGGLSQPGVSQGMRELVEGDIVQREYARSGEKGRPAHRYHIGVSASEVLGKLENTRRDELMAEMAALDELRAAIKTR